MSTVAIFRAMRRRRQLQPLAILKADRPLVRPPRSLPLLAFALVLALGACAGSSSLDGIWRAQAPAGQATLISPNVDNPTGVELTIGIYGPDLAGLLRYYRAGSTGPLDRARSALSPNFECACNYMHDGRADLTVNTATFVLHGCLPGAVPKGNVQTRGRIALGADGRLQLTLVVDQPGSALDGQSQVLVFERTGQAADVDPSQLDCPLPSDPSQGNINSGL